MSKNGLNIFNKNYERTSIKASDLIREMESKSGLQYKMLVKKLKQHQEDALSNKLEMHVIIQGEKDFKVNGKKEIKEEYIIDGSKKDSYLEYVSKLKFKAKDKKIAEDFKNLMISSEVLDRIEKENVIAITGPISVIIKFCETDKVIEFREYLVDLTQ